MGQNKILSSPRSLLAFRVCSSSFQLSSVNLTNSMEITRELTTKAANFTNKRLFFSYLKELFETGVRLFSPITQQNDVAASNFSRVSFKSLLRNSVNVALTEDKKFQSGDFLKTPFKYEGPVSRKSR